MSATAHKKANSLINESSPYLLQHAYNPVNWVPFSKDAFTLAKKENKLVLISVGYSACHWCHVMEHESFEDEKVAEIMNKFFVNIKVDREERSDVDMLYMQAVQLMTGHGGWPLNCFVLPDGRPFYGGTYFRKEQWISILTNLADLYQRDPAKVEEFAGQLTEGIRQSELITTKNKQDSPLTLGLLEDTVAKWKQRLDHKEGGPDKAPKFPLPSNYQFLLRYAILHNDEQLLKHVHLTLTKMAFGGIYDQLYGGFARYSTDTIWKVPHFEKMLYDNSQLAALYCEAYTLTKNELYKEIAIETLGFVEKEWLTEEGAFYSAYDADSDGEEGKFYVWKKEDLTELLGEDYNLFSRYFKINDTGYWEHGNYILMREENVSRVLADFNITSSDLKEKIEKCKDILRQEAKSRIKPGLDDKTVTSWNAMMCTAYAKAYLSLGIERHREIALSSLNFILKTLSGADGKLFRTYKNGKAKISGFLDDYAFVIEALITCYIVTADEKLLYKAKELCDESLRIFKNEDSVFLYYIAAGTSELITRTTETSDNVIPASNSQMALNLFYMGHYFYDENYLQRAESMLLNVTEEMRNYGAGYSNWACLALHMLYPFREVAIVGKNVDEMVGTLYKHGITNAIFAVGKTTSELPLLKDRFVENKTMIYVCENKTCKLPVETIEEALEQIE